MLVHHGLVGGATLGAPWPELGEKNGLEWIAIERPGYGATPPMEMVRISDWCDLITPVLDALGITGSFAAVGLSAGGPYAYALAAGLPERVHRVAVVSGVPFLAAPGILEAYSAEARAAYARYAVGDDAALRDEFRAFCTAMAEKFRDDYDSSAVLSAILSYDAAGPAREARLQAKDWGFSQNAVTCPVDIWHSTADELVPFPAVQLSAQGLSDATLHEQVEASHFPSETSLRQMAQLLSAHRPS
ncbi:MAG: alpha/beta hydrolase [Myxococcota bacterium]